MRIGILTLPLHHNYGGILQAYALHTVLQRMGHEAFFIFQEKKYRLPWWKYPLAYGKRILFRYILGRKDIHIFQERRLKEQDVVIEQNIRKFTAKYIAPYILKCSVKEMQKQLDAIVVGSDQVWRPRYMPNITKAFLDFAINWNIKKISYASSFGVDTWEYSRLKTRECRKLIKYFNDISVREVSGIYLCEKYLKCKAIQVLDPTLLLTKDNYIKLITKRTDEKKISYYLLDVDSKKKNFLKNISLFFKISQIEEIGNSKTENLNLPLNKRIAPYIESWIESYVNSSFIITDSFHGCVFSIIFHRPFIAILNPLRGNSRMESLLELLDLSNRIIGNIDQFETEKLRNKIDWKNVDDKLNIEKKKSISFLKQSLTDQ